MSLIDRYVNAVRKRLPRAQRDDIASELREILRTQVEEEEAIRQRPLTDEETGQILKNYGYPRDVASRYGSPQYLIGPEVFASYVSSVKFVLWVLAPIALFMFLITVLTAEEHLAERIAGTLWMVLSIGLANLAIVTLLFARWGRTRSAVERGQDWSLDEVSELDRLTELLQDPHRPVRRGEAIGSLLGMVLLLCWWHGLNRAVWQWFGWPAWPFEWTGVWSSVSNAAIAVIVASMARELMGIIRPQWIRLYVGIGVTLDIFTLFVISRLLQSKTYVAPANGATGGGSAILVGLFDKVIFAILIVVTIGVTVGIVFGIRRLIYLSRERLSRSAV